MNPRGAASEKGRGRTVKFRGSQTEAEQEPALPLDRFKIVRMQTKTDKRIVGDLKVAIYGKVSQEQKVVAAHAEKMTGGWLKLTPDASLPVGEYAVVEMLGKEGMNLNVWDFGVNPAAAANPTAWKPERSAQPESDKPSDLKKRDQQ